MRCFNSLVFIPMSFRARRWPLPNAADISNQPTLHTQQSGAQRRTPGRWREVDDAFALLMISSIRIR